MAITGWRGISDLCLALSVDAPPRSALVGFTADPFGVRLRTCSLARSSLACNFARAAAAARLHRRRVRFNRAS